jgi:hypothetical protein
MVTWRWGCMWRMELTFYHPRFVRGDANQRAYAGMGNGGYGFVHLAIVDVAVLSVHTYPVNA